MNVKYEIYNLAQKPEFMEKAAEWFSGRFGVPKEAYLSSMNEMICSYCNTPQWYIVLYNEQIIGGCGIIDNDFHERTDLSPNLCALFIEPEFRGNGIAGNLLRYICADMNTRGISTLYLITEHIGFYEQYGWKFLCMVKENNKHLTRMYVHQI